MHAGTGQAPIDRFTAGGLRLECSPLVLADAFRWSVTRRVTRVATVPLEGEVVLRGPGADRAARRAAVRS